MLTDDQVVIRTKLGGACGLVVEVTEDTNHHDKYGEGEHEETHDSVLVLRV